MNRASPNLDGQTLVARQGSSFIHRPTVWAGISNADLPFFMFHTEKTIRFSITVVKWVVDRGRAVLAGAGAPILMVKFSGFAAMFTVNKHQNG